jgi:hypothetical protein
VCSRVDSSSCYCGVTCDYVYSCFVVFLRIIAAVSNRSL